MEYQLITHEEMVDALHDWVFQQTSAFSITDAAMVGLKLDASEMTRDMQTRIGVALRKLGCTKVERRNGMVRFLYRSPSQGGGSSVTRSADSSVKANLTREQKSAINKRANFLARSTYVAYKLRLEQWAQGMLASGGRVSEEKISAYTPHIDDLMSDKPF